MFNTSLAVLFVLVPLLLFYLQDTPVYYLNTTCSSTDMAPINGPENTALKS